MSVEISKLGKVAKGKVLPRDNKSPSACNGTPSGNEGRQKDAVASGSEGTEDSSGIEGSSGTLGIVCIAGIEGSCRVFGFLFQLSRLESTKEDHTLASNFPAE